jgi:hypothetical protein
MTLLKRALRSGAFFSFLVSISVTASPQQDSKGQLWESQLATQRALTNKIAGTLQDYIGLVLRCRVCAGCNNREAVARNDSSCERLTNIERQVRRELQSYLRVSGGQTAYVAFAEEALFIERLTLDEGKWEKTLSVSSWESYLGPFRHYTLGASRMEVKEEYDLRANGVVAIGLPVFDLDGYICAVYVVYPNNF